MPQLDAKQTGFTPELVQVFKGNYEAFRIWYDPLYKGVSAETIWKSIGGKLPKKKEDK